MEGLNEIRTAISSENIQLLQSSIVTYRKKLEVVLFIEQVSRPKRQDYGAMVHIPEDAVKQHIPYCLYGAFSVKQH